MPAGGDVMAYAARTAVTVNRSIAELERLVAKHGATGFGYGTDDIEGYSQVVFRIGDRMIRFRIAQPDTNDFLRTPTGLPRTWADARRFAAAEDQRLWRSLVLVVKALLVAVADGVLTLSDAFLPYTLMPGGRTAGEWLTPQLDTIYATGELPALMPGTGPREIEAPHG
jgi:hypothetical protein